MSKNIIIGKLGEDLASGYLSENGYKILFRNLRVGIDEIDIICRENDNTLVFCEIKTFADKQWAEGKDRLIPEDNITLNKLGKIRRGCQLFVGKHPDLVNEEKGWRIDVLALTIKKN